MNVMGVTGQCRGYPPLPLYLAKSQIMNLLRICIYILYILFVYTFQVSTLGWAGSRSGPEVLRTRRWALFWPSFNYTKGVKEFSGKDGGWLACEIPLTTIQRS